MSAHELPDDARFATRAVHAGLRPDPHFRSVIPAIHQTSTFAQPAPGEYVEEYDYARTANPTRRALEEALGMLEGGHATAFASGLAAENALITAVCEAGDHVVLPTRPLRRHLPARRQGARALGPAVHDGRPDRPRRARGAPSRRRRRSIWVETPTNPRLDVIDIAGVIARKRRRARRRRQHLRHAGQPAAARARRRRGDPLRDEVPRRALGHGARRGRRGRPGAARAGALRAERRGRDPRPDGLLPRPPRAAHAAPADGRERRATRAR